MLSGDVGLSEWYSELRREEVLLIVLFSLLGPAVGTSGKKETAPLLLLCCLEIVDEGAD